MSGENSSRGQLWRTAIHEAGHAVAHWHLNQTSFLGCRLPCLKYVVVNDDGSGLCAGNMCIYPDFCTMPPGSKLVAWRRSVRRRALADCIILMAGPIAEAFAAGIRFTSSWDWWSSGIHKWPDGDMVEQRLALVKPSGDWYAGRAFGVAIRIVRSHQPRISALADALLEHGMLDGDTVEDLLYGPA